MRRVATEAGVSPMGVYSRFGGKQGLVEALFRRGFDRLQEALESVGRDVEPMAAILEGCRQYRRFALDAPAVYSVMFSRVIPEFVPSDLCRRDAAGAFQVLVEGVRRGLASGALRPADAGTWPRASGRPATGWSAWSWPAWASCPTGTPTSRPRSPRSCEDSARRPIPDRRRWRPAEGPIVHRVGVRRPPRAPCDNSVRKVPLRGP